MRPSRGAPVVARRAQITPLDRARFKELVADPEWEADWAEKIKASKGGRTLIAYIVCGASIVSLTGRRTCSAECDTESRRRREQFPADSLGSAPVRGVGVGCSTGVSHRV